MARRVQISDQRIMFGALVEDNTWVGRFPAHPTKKLEVSGRYPSQVNRQETTGHEMYRFTRLVSVKKPLVNNGFFVSLEEKSLGRESSIMT